MDQLAEETNSLEHFLELKMVPPFPVNLLGKSWKVDKNSSTDTKEDREHVDQVQIVHNGTWSQCARTAFRRWEPPCPASGKPDIKAPNNKLVPTKKISRSTDIAKWIQLEKRGLHIGCQVSFNDANIRRKYVQYESLEKVSQKRYLRKDYKYPSIATLKYQAKENKGTLDDGYSWRKYGEKSILGSKYRRSYYRCSFKFDLGCCATRTVQRLIEDPSIFEVIYRGKHTCPPALRNNCFSTETESACTTTDSHFELAKRPQVLDFYKKWSTKARNTEWTQKVKVSSKTGSDMPPEDGYIWRKYGQKEIFGAKYPRSYFKCTIRGCNARKHVQISDDDSSILKITYEGMHTCLRLAVTSNSENETESSYNILNASDFSTAMKSELRTLKTRDSSSTTESTSTITDNSSGLYSMRKMSGCASIQSWKQQTKEILSSFSPSLKLQLPSSSSTSEPNIIISEIEENSSSNIPSYKETPQNAEQCPSPVLENGVHGRVTPSLVHHMSLPKISSEKAAGKKTFRFEQDLIPYTKRGCSTHPRSIAERVRRTQISSSMRKLQELFPNMDKQTSTADNLDLAVQHIKDLHKKMQTLKDARARCTCSSKQ